MIKGKTNSGFEFEIEDCALDNMELMELLMEIDDGNVLALPKAFISLLGEKQYKKLKEFIKERDGVVKITSMVEEFASITNAQSELKN